MANKKKHEGKDEKSAIRKEAFILYHEKKKSVREIAENFHVSPRTIWRWIRDVERDLREDGNARPRKPRPRVKRFPNRVFARILQLKEENPRRPATTIHRLLKDELDEPCPSLSTIRKYLAAKGLSRKE